ncbi:Hypothetical predicted protein [Olea europaea subsp. europaea]|uniref:NYN domain-containing protein n=1 Tax=Olea europaea subsp. europaea TaxID=158383 RepID=A0A8S0R4L6_OLEEU|nr:Hypothetical predicted protein [Olea europaea subsp. europaea]
MIRVKLVGVPYDAAYKKILADMFSFALDNRPPSSILLISRERDFAPALHVLGQRGYTIILVIPLSVGVSSALSNASQFLCNWSNVARGHGFMPQARANVARFPDESDHYRSSDWARVFEATTQRRTEVLMPENLENMWTIGRNYKKKLQKNTARGPQVAQEKILESSTMLRKDLVTEVPMQKPELQEEWKIKHLFNYLQSLNQIRGLLIWILISKFIPRGSIADELEHATSVFPRENRNQFKRSNSTSDLKAQLNMEDMFGSKGETPIISEFYNPNISRHNIYYVKSASDMLVPTEGLHNPKLRCRVGQLIFLIFSGIRILRDCIGILRTSPIIRYIYLPKGYSHQALRMLLFISVVFSLTSIYN